MHARVCALGWSCDGKLLAAASTDRFIRIWNNLNNNNNVAFEVSLNDESDKAMNHKHIQVAFHPNIPTIFACCNGSVLFVYSIGEDGGESGSLVLLAKYEFKGPVLNLSWNIPGNLLLLGTKSDSLICLSFVDLCLSHLWTFDCQFEANQFAFTQDDQVLIAGSPGSLYAFEDGNASIKELIRLASATSYSLARSLNGSVAIGSADATISLFEGNNLKQPVSCISRSEWPIRHLSYSYDGLFLAAGSEDKFIDISHSPDGGLVYRLAASNAVNALAWHPNSYLLAFSCDRVDKNGRSEFVVNIFGFSQ